MEKSDSGKDLESLRRDVLSLPDSNDREDALKAIAELEATRHSLGIQISSKEGTPGPEREETSFVDSCRLLMLLKSAGSGIRKQAIEEIKSRYDSEEKLVSHVKTQLGNPLYRDRISTKFKFRKYTFRCVTILLVIIAAFVGSNALAWGWSRDTAVAGITLGFIVSYWFAGHLLWRCPACEYKLGFGSTYGQNSRMLRSSLKTCPRCGASFL